MTSEPQLENVESDGSCTGTAALNMTHVLERGGRVVQLRSDTTIPS
jgi:hypothetical protein